MNTEFSSCANCGAAVDSRFCAHCGQRLELPVLALLFAVMVRLTLFFRRPRIAETWVVSLFGTGISMLLHATVSPLLYELHMDASARVPLVLAAVLAILVAAVLQNLLAVLYAYWPEVWSG
jgi:hypothetical protein